MSTPDGLVNVCARSSQAKDYLAAEDFWSDRVPAMGLDKDGFFSKRGRWLKSMSAADLGNSHKADYLGPLPAEQFDDYCSWAER